jgi:hypothetical protein
VFALEINTNLASDKTIWSFGQIAAARKSLADRCQTSQFANVFKRTDDTFYSETQIWDILNEGVQSWQEASVNRNKTGDANEKLTGDDVILEQLAAAKQLVAAKASAMAVVRRQKTEYGASMSACQERHLQGAQRKDRCLTNLKQLVRIFSARESEVAHTFEQTHGRQPTTDQLLELVFEDREERELAMIKEWFANKQVSDRRAMRKCAASYGGIVVDSDGDSEAGSSGEASDVLMKSDSERSQASTKRVSRCNGVQAPRRKTATHTTSEDMDQMALNFHAQMDRSFDMNANFLKEWAGHQKKVLELQAKQAQAQADESKVKVEESKLKNLQTLLDMGHLSPNTKQKLVQTAAKTMFENM